MYYSTWQKQGLQQVLKARICRTYSADSVCRLFNENQWSLISYLGSRIPDPKTATKERGGKKFVVITFYAATNFTKLQIILVFECWRKKFGPIFKELYVELFTQKIDTQLSKIWVWDPGSGKNLFRIPDPGVKKAPDPGSGSATLTGKAFSSLLYSSSSGLIPFILTCGKSPVTFNFHDIGLY